MPTQVAAPVPLGVAVLTISDTRSEGEDVSGRYLVEQLGGAGHWVAEYAIEIDDVYRIRACLSAWLIDPRIQVIMTTGGTGLRERDRTPEAVRALFDREVEGFGELFRAVSVEDVGTSTLQSRSLAGLANRRLIFCLPGSPAACRTAWERILRFQLDSGHKPCNFVQLLPMLNPWPERDDLRQPARARP